MRDLIHTENVDLVHARSRAPAWSGYFASRASGVPFVTTFHNAYSYGNAAKKLYNSVMARGDRVIAISEFIAEHIRRDYAVPAERIALVPRGIDFGIYDPAQVTLARKESFRSLHRLPSGRPLIILPARLSPTKGHELALRALSLLGDHAFHCLIIGPGQGRTAYRQRLITIVQDLKLDDKVDFVERIDLAAAYSLADLVLSLSSKQEGFGRVAAEAQAMGIPVVATAIGALTETVLEGETGWLVPPGDVPALATAVVGALSQSRERRAAMAEKAILHARSNFNVRRMCALTLAVYADLIETRSFNKRRHRE